MRRSARAASGRLAHAARWEPAMLVELVELFGSLGPLQLNNLAGDYRAFVIAAYEQGNVRDPLKRRPLVLHGGLRLHRLSAERKGPGGAPRIPDAAASRRSPFPRLLRGLPPWRR